jgi:hypothetical protein
MANRNELGGYRDSRLEIENLARSTGDILNSAVQDLIETHAQYFRQDGTDLKHVLSGETIEEFVGALKKTKPHWYASYSPITEEQVEAEIIEQACLSPTPASLAKLFKLVGEHRYHEILKQWGTDPARMKPGQRPEWASKPEVKKATNRRANPWSQQGWNVTRQGEILKSQGTEMASSLARSVGCVIGSTRPNLDPKFN